MAIKKIKSVIESVLFINGEPIEIEELSKFCDANVNEIAIVIEELIEDYKDRGINIIRLNNSIQMCTNPSNEDAVSDFFKPVKKTSLSTAAVETLSIIAYKQPITRSEIEALRQVQCTYVLKYLLSHDLIKVVGHKKTLGNPALYATTDEFLRILGIESLKELPAITEPTEEFETI